jgi:putative glycosyltransferase (TIGR04372 family)
MGRWLKYLDRWNQIIPGGQIHTLRSSITSSRDKEGLFERFDTSLDFLEEENVSAIKWLTTKGWRAGEPIVCLLVRDSKFLEEHWGDLETGAYHDYRNSDVTTYMKACEWLASQGVWVLRMGSLMATRLEFTGPRIIDYAFEPEKSDLLDIWLFANCSGIISTATGLDQLGMIYKVPQLYLNAMPLGGAHTWTNMIWVPKNLRWHKSRKPLTLGEYLENSYLDTKEYLDAGIDVIDLTPDEILKATQEFLGKLTGGWVSTRKGIEIQDKFWRIFQKWSDYGQWHGWLHPKASIGSDWLLSQSRGFFAKGRNFHR